MFPLYTVARRILMIADEMKVDKVQTGKRIKKLMDEKGDTVLTLS